MENEKNKKEEELPITPTEEVAEVGFANIDQALVEKNITQEVLTIMKTEFMILKVNGLDDKEGYKLVDEKRKLVKKTRVLAKNICQEGRAHAIAEQKAWIAKEKEVTGELEAIELYLEAELKVVDDEKKRLQEEKERIEATRIQNRTAQLIALGMELVGDNYVLNNIHINTLHVRIYDDFTYAGVLAPVVAEYERLQIVKAEEARLKAEEEAEFKRIQEEQRLEREKLDRERAEFEASQKKAKEIEEARIKAAEEEKAAIEKQKAELQAAKISARTKVVYGLGMSFNGTDFVFGPIVLSKEVLSTCSDTEFDQHIENMTPLINGRKEAIEKQRAAEIEAEKKSAIEKALAEQEEKNRIEAENKAREEARRKNEEEIARQLEEKKLAEVAAMQPDRMKFEEYIHKLESLPTPEFNSPSYKEFGELIQTTIKQVVAHLHKKKPQ